MMILEANSAISMSFLIACTQHLARNQRQISPVPIHGDVRASFLSFWPRWVSLAARAFSGHSKRRLLSSCMHRLVL